MLCFPFPLFYKVNKHRQLRKIHKFSAATTPCLTWHSACGRLHRSTEINLLKTLEEVEVREGPCAAVTRLRWSEVYRMCPHSWSIPKWSKMYGLPFRITIESRGFGGDFSWQSFTKLACWYNAEKSWRSVSTLPPRSPVTATHVENHRSIRAWWSGSGAPDLPQAWAEWRQRALWWQTDW